MVKQVNIAEAKARLSELVDAATRGNDVVIARAGRPVARIVPFEAPTSRTLGFVDLPVDDALFAALDGPELDAWG
jgi:prevent-host-death family protein